MEEQYYIFIPSTNQLTPVVSEKLGIEIQKDLFKENQLYSWLIYIN